MPTIADWTSPITGLTTPHGLPTDWSPGWVDRMPREGHWVYLLKASIPGRDPEWDGVETVYVGVTSSLRARLRSHARKWWWPVVDPALCEFECYISRSHAEAAERQEIWDLRPAMNRAGRLLVVTR